jgi:histidinol-phosphate aminotransferase
MKGLMLNTQLLQVPLYVAGKSPEQVRQELGVDEVLRLCSNENPLGPSPLAIDALHKAFAQTHRYPGMAELDLRRRLAIYHGNGLTEQHFIVGNGATDVLRMVAQAFIFDEGESVMCSVSFPLFSLLTTMYGGKSVRVPPRSDFGLDLDAIGGSITSQTRVVWLCSPNNPTGFVLSQNEMDEFMERLPEHVLVVFDEAYCDFVTESDCVDSIRYVRQRRNVIAVRSFSKSCGLANLRVGYGIAAPEIIEYLLHTVLPFNTGGAALAAAIASLDDHEFWVCTRELVQRERVFLHRRLSEMGLTCLPSQANFLLIVDPPIAAPALVQALLRQAVVVRPMGGFGLPNALRVTVGSREQNERFLAAMHAVTADVTAQAVSTV